MQEHENEYRDKSKLLILGLLRLSGLKQRSKNYLSI